MRWGTKHLRANRRGAKAWLLFVAFASLVACLCLVLLSWKRAAANTQMTKLSDEACLRKIAFDLTHKVPSTEVEQSLRDGSRSLSDIVDAYMASEDFVSVAFGWHQELYSESGVSTPDDLPSQVRAEPAQIATYLLLSGADYRKVVTGKFEVSPDGLVTELEGRGAGVLDTKHMLSRESGMLNRNWAGMIQRQMTGIVLQAVTIGDDEPDTSVEGIANNPKCAGCHDNPIYGIDRLAKFRSCYDAAGARLGDCEDPVGTFLGVDGRGLEDLGQILADSTEFESQIVNFFFERLFGRRIYQQEKEFYGKAAVVFERSGYNAKALVKHLVTTENYCSR